MSAAVQWSLSGTGEASTRGPGGREGNDLTDKQPNIVVFSWDNLGWGGLGCYGGLGWAIHRAHERGEAGTTVKVRLARPPTVAAGPRTV